MLQAFRCPAGLRDGGFVGECVLRDLPVQGVKRRAFRLELVERLADRLGVLGHAAYSAPCGLLTQHRLALRRLGDRGQEGGFAVVPMHQSPPLVVHGRLRRGGLHLHWRHRRLDCRCFPAAAADSDHLDLGKSGV